MARCLGDMCDGFIYFQNELHLKTYIEVKSNVLYYTPDPREYFRHSHGRSHVFAICLFLCLE